MFFNKNKLQKEIKIKTVSYITAALSLIAALAWNDAIKSLIDFFFPLDKNSILVKFIYAAIITIFIVMAGLALVKLSDTRKENK